MMRVRIGSRVGCLRSPRKVRFAEDHWGDRAKTPQVTDRATTRTSAPIETGAYVVRQINKELYDRLGSSPLSAE